MKSMAFVLFLLVVPMAGGQESAAVDPTPTKSEKLATPEPDPALATALENAIFPVLEKGSNLDVSFFIVEQIDAKGNSHRFAANKVTASPDATLQGFSMLISTIMPEREIGTVTAMFKIGDELWAFGSRSIARLNNGRLIVNTRLSVKDQETGSTELISKEPYMSVKVIGNREQNVTEFIDVGVKIEAQPTILDNRHVHTKMKMSISEVLRENDTSRETRVPIVSFRKVDTSIDFVPGKLELLSELTIQKTIDTESGLPYLRNIPLIGKLFFSHTSKKMVNTKLFIVGGVGAPQEEQIKEYEALKKKIEDENKKKMKRLL